MFICIDESGSFVYSDNEGSWNCVAAYIYPEGERRRVEYAVAWLKRQSGLPYAPEVKLRDTTEADYRGFLEVLRDSGGVCCAVATNASFNLPKTIEEHQRAQEAKILENVDIMVYEAGRQGIRVLAERVRGLSPQLYVQMVAQVELAKLVLNHASLYMVQRFPPSLGHFRWRIEQKSSSQTEYETAYTQVLPAFLQSASLREPLPMLRGADYRWFERNYYPVGGEPTYLQDTYGVEDPDAGGRKINVGQIAREDVRFVDSKHDAGVQVADLLASGLRRCLRGGFKDNGSVASELGTAMLQAPYRNVPVKLIGFTVNDDEEEGAEADRTAANALFAMRRTARALLQ